MKQINIAIAGLGNVGSNLIETIEKNKNLIQNKSNIIFNILGVSAKNKSKKRIININNYYWYDDANDLLNIDDLDLFIELIGEEKGLSYKLVKNSLNKKISVITANKALLSKHGNELFEIAEKNNTFLLFEAAVAGGIPVIKIIKNSIFLNKIIKISGILNGTTNFILTEMENKNISYEIALKMLKKRDMQNLILLMM